MTSKVHTALVMDETAETYNDYTRVLAKFMMKRTTFNGPLCQCRSYIVTKTLWSLIYRSVSEKIRVDIIGNFYLI